jgi:hypothetical protein
MHAPVKQKVNANASNIKVCLKRDHTDGEHDNATREEKQSECNLPALIGDCQHDEIKKNDSKSHVECLDQISDNSMTHYQQITTHLKGARCDRRECWGVNRVGILALLS